MTNQMEENLAQNTERSGPSSSLDSQKKANESTDEQGEGAAIAEPQLESADNRLPWGLTHRDLILHIAMPFALVLLAATLGTCIGSRIQDRSFRNNEMFRAKLESLNKSQSAAKGVLERIDLAFKTIESTEIDLKRAVENIADEDERKRVNRYYIEHDATKSSRQTLKEALIELNAMATSTEGLVADPRLTHAVSNFDDKLAKYLGCLQDRTDYSTICSREHPEVIPAMRAVVRVHDRLEADLIADYE